MNHETLCKWARQVLPENGQVWQRQRWTSYSIGPKPYRLFVHHDNVGFYQGRRYQLQLNASAENLDAVQQHSAVLSCVRATAVGLGRAGPFRLAVALMPNAADASVEDLLAAAVGNRWFRDA